MSRTVQAPKWPGSQKPMNWDYLAERLHDVALLQKAIVVCGDTAVPVGGRRKGGFVCIARPAQVKKAIALLSKCEGFPNLRWTPGTENYPDNVHWGEVEPPEPPEHMSETDLEFVIREIDIGLYYGYSDEAIAAYVLPRVKRERGSKARLLKFVQERALALP